MSWLAKLTKKDQEKEISGFLCPMCNNKDFGSAEKLQDHFNRQHAVVETPPRSSYVASSSSLPSSKNEAPDVLKLESEIEDLSASLKEEKWYSASLRDELTKAEDKCAALEKELDDLRGSSSQGPNEQEPKISPEELEVLRASLSELQQSSNMERSKLEAQLAEKTSLLTASESSLTLLNTQHASLQAEHTTLKTSFETLTTSHKALLEAQNSSLDGFQARAAEHETNMAAIKGQNDVLNARIVELQAELSALRSTNAVLDNKLSQANTELVETRSEKQLCEDKISSLQEQMSLNDAQHKRALAAASSSTSKAEAGRSEAEKELTRVKEAHKTLELEYQGLLGDLKEGEGANNEALKHLQTHSSSLQGQLSEAETTIAELRGKLETQTTLSDSLQNDLLSEQDSHSRTRASVDELRANIAAMSSLKENLSSQCTSLKEQLAAEKEANLGLNKMKIDLETNLENAKNELIASKDKFKVQHEEDAAKISELKEKSAVLNTSLAEKNDEMTKIVAALTQIKTRFDQLEIEHGGMARDLLASVDALRAKDDELLALREDHKEKLMEEARRCEEVRTKLLMAEESLSVAQNTVSQHEHEIVGLQNGASHQASVIAEKEALLSDQTVIMQQLETDLTNAQNKIKELEGVVVSRGDELERLTARLDEHIAMEATINEQITKQEQATLSLHRMLDSCKEKLAAPCEMCLNYEIQINRIHQQCQSFKDKAAASDAEHVRTKRTLQDTISLLNNTKEQVLAYKEQLDVSTAKSHAAVASLTQSLEEVTDVAEHAKRNYTALKGEHDVLTERHAALIDSHNVLQGEHKALDIAHNALSGQLEELQQKIASTQDSLTKATSEKNKLQISLNELEASHTDLEQKHIVLVEEKNGIQALLEETKNIFISQKLELQATLKKTKAELDGVMNSRDSLQSQLDDLSKKSVEEGNSLRGEIQKEKARVSELERELKTTRQQHAADYQALQGDLTRAQHQATELQKQIADLDLVIKTLKNEKSSLEAKISMLLGEKQQVLERCTAVEAQLLDSQVGNNKLRETLNDAQCAIRELAEENSDLQVQVTTITNRKWQSDKEATHCSSCQSAFSLANRKHHCRNCGSIFCQPCSSQVAKTQSSKKPVRVCDACFKEVASFQ